MSSIHKTEAPNLCPSYLKDMDVTFVNMCKAILVDDISICETAVKNRFNPNSSRAQKFFLQTPLYRNVLNYAIYGSMTQTSYAISHVVTTMGTSFQTISKIVNEAEAEGYFKVYNKGEKTSKTTFAAVPWLVVDFMKKYCVGRADGWNVVLRQFDTDSFHTEYEKMKSDPVASQRFSEVFEQAGYKALKDESSY